MTNIPGPIRADRGGDEGVEGRELMAVYVDDMWQYPMGRFGRMKMSHMIADTESELHLMAFRIGVATRWFQRKASGDHYDIAISKRTMAVLFGAREITLKQCAAMCANRRETGSLGDPSTAIADMLARREAHAALAEFDVLKGES